MGITAENKGRKDEKENTNKIGYEAMMMITQHLKRKVKVATWFVSSLSVRQINY